VGLHECVGAGAFGRSVRMADADCVGDYETVGGGCAGGLVWADWG
jgi:hypothetical protein